MASKKIFTKRSFLNALVSSGIFFANTINIQRSSAGTQEIINLPEIVSYRSASCGCCKKWINNLRAYGY